MRPALVASIALCCAACVPHAQNCPVRPVRLAAPFALGDGSEIVARAAAEFSTAVKRPEMQAPRGGVVRKFGVKAG